MKKIIDYMVEHEDDLTAFTENMACWISEGWVPIGGVCVSTADDSEWWHQALVKYEKDN